MNGGGHQDLVRSIGPYLSGVLDAEARGEVREHLGDCAVCRDELVHLATVPGLLAEVGPPLDDDLPPPAPGLRDRLLAEVAARRWAERRRALLPAAVLGGLLVLAVAGLAVTRGAPRGATAAEVAEPAFVAMVPLDPARDLGGRVAAEGREWGTEVALDVAAAPAGERLVLVADAVDGRREVVANWTGTGDPVRLRGATSFPRDQLARLVVTTLSGEELLVAGTDG
jgi:anti-sigma factor RsiW